MSMTSTRSLLNRCIKYSKMVMWVTMLKHRHQLEDKVVLDNIKIGDKVAVECYTSMGTSMIETVTRIKTKYNEHTGKGYKVICCGSHEFSAKTGDALTPPTMYYISHKVVPKKEKK